MDKNKCIDVCNELLRGELSAIETYDQALEKFGKQPEAAKLRTIKADHLKSANTLRDNIVSMGGKPAKDSGTWGTFVKAVNGNAKLLGESSAISALKQGEEHGVSEYQEALENEELMPECKTMIRTELLPRVTQHVSQLNSISAIV
ncbi:MAG: DUF2383 domain-containing protein [Bdellovibrionales bacterium]|nr:DUF2383 domain-containing protein [Bdellovibrionales bacterium]